MGCGVSKGAAPGADAPRRLNHRRRLLEAVFKEMDVDGNGNVDFAEFVRTAGSAEEAVELKHAFRVMDDRGDGNGTLSLDEWTTSMLSRAEVCPAPSCPARRPTRPPRTVVFPACDLQHVSDDEFEAEMESLLSKLNVIDSKKARMVSLNKARLHERQATNDALLDEQAGAAGAGSGPGADAGTDGGAGAASTGVGAGAPLNRRALLERVFTAMDEDGDGKVDLDEFVRQAPRSSPRSRRDMCTSEISARHMDGDVSDAPIGISRVHLRARRWRRLASLHFFTRSSTLTWGLATATECSRLTSGFAGCRLSARSVRMPSSRRRWTRR